MAGGGILRARWPRPKVHGRVNGDQVPFSKFIISRALCKAEFDVITFQSFKIDSFLFAKTFPFRSASILLKKFKLFTQTFFLCIFETFGRCTWSVAVDKAGV